MSVAIQCAGMCMPGDRLAPVGEPAERCTSCSTRSTILVAALSACSSAYISCFLRLRLGVPFAAVDVRGSCSSLVVSLSADSLGG